jgi:hypothetical protein
MRYLTKSRFKLGLECPNKLFYTNKNKEYANTKSNDPFLQALASGGFQVEEMARLHYPHGILVEDDSNRKEYDYQEKVNQTIALLKQDEVVIFEAAFMFDNLFIRVDILEKKGDLINLIEVKAKSFYGSEGLTTFSGKRGISKNWKAYLFDVAFQKYVIQTSFPEFKVIPYLMLADKDKSTTVHGLNQMFRIKKSEGNRTGIQILKDQISQLDLKKDSVLSLVDVTPMIQKIEMGEERILPEYAFVEAIKLFAKAYKEDCFFDYELKFNICKKCEFKTSSVEMEKGLLSGFENCFSRKLNWKEEDFNAPNVFEIWDFKSWISLIDRKVIKLEDIDDQSFGRLKPEDGKITRIERQLIQKNKSLAENNNPHILKDALKAELENWEFPLNFIDFEAATVALPFYAGQKPYEKVVFQFSHHIFHENERIEHAHEYINVEAGNFPNFEFVRQLKKALSVNQGTVFQYSNYENTTLNQLKVQIENSNEADKAELLQFIKTIATPSTDKDYKSEVWTPIRPLIDLCEVIKAYYYNPFTKGSNSIKAVLPAIFRSSSFIREKYSHPLDQINLGSKNFSTDHVWLHFEQNEVVDPYKLLGKPFAEWDEDFERMTEIEEINDGGAALTAYGLTQYTDMSNEERNAIKASLLKYCELDTLAMVMIYEHLKELCK